MFLAAAFDFCSLVEVKNQLACPCGILRLFLTSPRCIMKKEPCQWVADRTRKTIFLFRKGISLN